MNRDDAKKVLVRRRDLTGEQFNDGTIDAWLSALNGHTCRAVLEAVADAAREHERVNVHHVAERLPATHRPVTPTEPVTFACMDPEALKARAAYWSAVFDPTQRTPTGHYPGCPCESCTRRPSIDAEWN